MPAGLAIGAITGATSLVGAAVSSSAASKAADKASAASKEATEASLALQGRMYDTTRADQGPYRAAGYGALNKLNARLGITPQGDVTTSAPSSYAPASSGASPSAGGPASAAGGYASPGGTTPTGARVPAAPTYGAYEAANPDLAAEAKRVTATGQFPSEAAYFAWHDANFGSEGRPSSADPATAAAGSDGSTGAPNVLTGDNLTIPDRAAYGARSAVADAPTYNAPALGAGPSFQAPTPKAGTAFQAPALQAATAYKAAPVTAATAYSAAPRRAATAYSATPITPGKSYSNDTYARPDYKALDTSISSFRNSPGYQYQQDEAEKNVLGHFAQLGGLGSGAALKALSDRSQSIADQDYNQWKSDTTSQYNQDRNVFNTSFDTDTSRTLQDKQYGAGFNEAQRSTDNAAAQRNAEYGAGLTEQQRTTDNTTAQRNAEYGSTFGESQRTTDNSNAIDLSKYGSTFNEGQRTTDNAAALDAAKFGATYGEGQREYDKSYELTNAQNDYNARNSGYQYKTGQDQNNYTTDRAYATDLYDDDRGYTTGRYDTGTNNLFKVAGLGQGAVDQTSAAGQNYANQGSGAYFSNAAGQTSAANTRANGVLAGVNGVENAIGQGLNAGAYLYGKKGATTGSAAAGGYATDWYGKG